MAELTFAEIFGSSAYVSDPDLNPQDPYPPEISMVLSDLQNVEAGGEILGGLGINNVNAINEIDIDQFARQIFYALILRIIQFQAENINADPTQKMFINEQTPRLGTGGRSGQVQRSFLVSFFADTEIEGIADIDNI